MTLFLVILLTRSVSKLHSVNNRMIGGCGAVCGMTTGRGNEITRRRRASVSIRPPQILYKLTWN
jgi:hypothetical protein